MRQDTKVERPHAKQPPAGAPHAELDEAITWLSQHVGFPAPSRAAYEARPESQRR